MLQRTSSNCSIFGFAASRCLQEDRLNIVGWRFVKHLFHKWSMYCLVCLKFMIIPAIVSRPSRTIFNLPGLRPVPPFSMRQHRKASWRWWPSCATCLRWTRSCWYGIVVQLAMPAMLLQDAQMHDGATPLLAAALQGHVQVVSESSAEPDLQSTY